MILIAQSWINLHDVFWNAGMLEYWNIGLKIGIGLCLIYTEMPFDQENPVIPGPDRLCKNVRDNTFIYTAE
jgi:hypothetical protein